MQNKLGNQLKQHRLAKGLSQSKMAKLLGVSLRTYQNYESGSTHPNKIGTYESVVKLLAQDIQNGAQLVAHPGEQRPNKTNNKVPFYEIDVSASVVEVFTDSAIETPSSELSVPGLEDCDFAVPVYGHSMYPIYENGTIIVCKEIRDKRLINYGEVYFIVTRDYRMVKRLQKGSKESTILAESENTEKRLNGQLKYEPIELPMDDILKLYLVKGCIKRNQL